METRMPSRLGYKTLSSVITISNDPTNRGVKHEICVDDCQRSAVHSSLPMKTIGEEDNGVEPKPVPSIVILC